MLSKPDIVLDVIRAAAKLVKAIGRRDNCHFRLFPQTIGRGHAVFDAELSIPTVDRSPTG